jgi:hypothetical protein
MWMRVASAVNPIKGSHGQLDRHGAIFDCFPRSSRKNRITKVEQKAHVPPDNPDIVALRRIVENKISERAASNSR